MMASARLAKLEVSKSALDFAPIEAFFVSFSDTSTLDERLNVMKGYLKNFPQHKAVVSNRFKGPRNNGHSFTVGYARFIDTDMRDKFLEAAESVLFKFGNSTLRVLSALPKLARRRD